MHKIHWFFCRVFTKSYQLTLILLTLSCNLTVSQWIEFWLELKSAKKECVHIGAGGVDFNCKVLQKLPSHSWTGPPGLILFHLKYAKALRHSWLPRESCHTSWHQVMKLFYYFVEEAYLSSKIPLPSPDLPRNLPIKEKYRDSSARIERYLWIGAHFPCTMRCLWNLW